MFEAARLPPQGENIAERVVGRSWLRSIGAFDVRGRPAYKVERRDGIEDCEEVRSFAFGRSRENRHRCGRPGIGCCCGDWILSEQALHKQQRLFCRREGFRQARSRRGGSCGRKVLRLLRGGSRKALSGLRRSCACWGCLLVLRRGVYSGVVIHL